MKKLFGLFIFSSLCVSAIASDIKGEESLQEREMLEVMLGSLQDGNYENFVRFGSDDFKKLVTEDVLSSMKEFLKLEKYQLAFLGLLDRKHYTESCWKLQDETHNKEYLIRFSVDGDEVLGIIIQ